MARRHRKISSGRLDGAGNQSRDGAPHTDLLDHHRPWPGAARHEHLGLHGSSWRPGSHPLRPKLSPSFIARRYQELKLSNVRLLATDYAAVFRFYRDVIGLQPTWGDEASGYADFNVGEGVGLALFDRREMISAIGAAVVASEGSGTDRVALVFAVDDLDATAARLREQGIALVSEPA